MLWLICAVVIDRMLLKYTAHQYKPEKGEFQSGYATLDSIANNAALAPMAYRVLFPVIITGIERLIPPLRKQRLPLLYEPLRILFLTLALTLTAHTIGTTGALVVAVFIVATVYFDYWDFTVELFAFAAALTGDLQLAVMGAGLAAFSRMETAGLVVLTYGLVTGNVGGTLYTALAAVIPMLALRVWAGNRRLYCKRTMWRVNWRDVRNLFNNRPFYLSETAMSLVVTAFTIAAVLSGAKAGLVPLILLVMGWIGGRAAETRIFMPCLLWIGMLWR